MNWVMDRDALSQRMGRRGLRRGRRAHHSADGAGQKLPTSTRSRRRATAGASPKAKAEMAKSKYANSNGVCTDKTCKGVLLITDVRAVDKRCCRRPVERGEDRHHLHGPRSVNGAYPVIQTTSKNIPISTRPRWFKDYADPSTFFDPLFNGTSIIPSGNTNYALLGLKPVTGESARSHREHERTSPASTAGRSCAAKLTGNSRTNCYAALDKVADDEGRAVDPVHVGQDGHDSRARTSRSGTSTRTPASLRWRTSPSSRELAEERTNRAGPLGAPLSSTFYSAMLLYIVRRTVWAISRRPHRPPAHVRGLLPAAGRRSGASLRR